VNGGEVYCVCYNDVLCLVSVNLVIICRKCVICISQCYQLLSEYSISVIDEGMGREH